MLSIGRAQALCLGPGANLEEGVARPDAMAKLSSLDAYRRVAEERGTASSS